MDSTPHARQPHTVYRDEDDAAVALATLRPLGGRSYVHVKR